MKKSLGAKTIVYPTPVFIVGTYDKAGKPNVMNVAWGGLCCSSPPSIAISLRKATYTYGNIVDRKAFTVNIPSETHVKEADYFGIASGSNEDKFSTTGLTPVKSELVDAPYIGEFPLILECKLTHAVEIGLHTQFIGEILDVKADEFVLGENGVIDIEKIHPILYAPEIRAYYGIGVCLGKAFSIGKQIKSY
ncbi:MAG: flavin reductase family protein [Candidatus Brocadia sp.]|jgi:flavin reductase (DIM6/NTAB) family NADH-FMN oxidoreductase RutF